MDVWSERTVNIMGHGFEASFEEVRAKLVSDESRGPDRRRGLIARDAAGRIRQEIRAVGTNGEVVAVTSIVDPVAREVRFLLGDPPQLIRQMELRSDWSVTLPNDWRPAIAEQPNVGIVDVEELGNREIEGLLCYGRRVTTADEEAETWFSAELPDQPIWIRAVTSTEEYTFRLFDIRRREPAPDLFRAPN